MNLLAIRVRYLCSFGKRLILFDIGSLVKFAGDDETHSRIENGDRFGCQTSYDRVSMGHWNSPDNEVIVCELTHKVRMFLEVTPGIVEFLEHTESFDLLLIFIEELLQRKSPTLKLSASHEFRWIFRNLADRGGNAGRRE